MLTEALIRESDAATKEEAIRELADLLFAEGRVSSAVAVERALWAREAQSTTGFGGGVAIPHCKHAAVSHDSIAILRLKTPVAWGAMDGEPVGFLICLAMRGASAGNHHLKVFATLSRQLVKDDFREALISKVTPAAILELLEERVFSKVKSPSQ